MPSEIVRWNEGPSQNVVFTNADGTTGGFNMAVYSGAIIHVVSVAGGATTLTWKVKERESSATAYTLADSTDAVQTTTVQAGRAYAVPDAAFAAGYVLATTNAGTVTCRVIVKG